MVKNRTIENPNAVQAASAQYLSPRYLSPKRFSSIGWQYRLCIETNSNSFLDVGSGNNILSWLLSKAGKQIISIDHNFEVRPDIVGLLPQLPVRSKAVETALCFQVLEHLPFQMVLDCLKEFKRISSKYVIISVPDQSDILSNRIKLMRAFADHMGFPKRWKTPLKTKNEEHFWELGFDQIDSETFIILAKRCGLTIQKDFQNNLYPYHHFFVFTI